MVLKYFRCYFLFIGSIFSTKITLNFRFPDTIWTNRSLTVDTTKMSCKYLLNNICSSYKAEVKYSVDDLIIYSCDIENVAGKIVKIPIKNREFVENWKDLVKFNDIVEKHPNFKMYVSLCKKDYLEPLKNIKECFINGKKLEVDSSLFEFTIDEFIDCWNNIIGVDGGIELFLIDKIKKNISSSGSPYRDKLKIYDGGWEIRPYGDFSENLYGKKVMSVLRINAKYKIHVKYNFIAPPGTKLRDCRNNCILEDHDINVTDKFEDVCEYIKRDIKRLTDDSVDDYEINFDMFKGMSPEGRRDYEVNVSLKESSNALKHLRFRVKFKTPPGFTYVDGLKPLRVHEFNIPPVDFDEKKIYEKIKEWNKENKIVLPDELINSSDISDIKKYLKNCFPRPEKLYTDCIINLTGDNARAFIKECDSAKDIKCLDVEENNDIKNVDVDDNVVGGRTSSVDLNSKFWNKSKRKSCCSHCCRCCC